MLGYLFLLIVVVSATSGQFLNCGFVNSLHCATHTPGEMCGSDGNDYTNRCYLAQAQCKDRNLQTIATGTCASNGFTVAPGVSTPLTITPGISISASTKTSTPLHTSSTTTREPVFVNHDHLLDFLCLELMHMKCPTDTGKVCGTDGVTYANHCEFDKQRCAHRSLKVHAFHAC